MTYKGYTGITEVDEDSGELFGTVIGLRDVLTFVGKTVEDARRSFEQTIDFYLKSCLESGKEPDKPFAGQFMVRIDSETHRRLATLAAIHKITMNDFIAQALEEFTNAHQPNTNRVTTNSNRIVPSKQHKRSGRVVGDVETGKAKGKTG